MHISAATVLTALTASVIASPVAINEETVSAIAYAKDVKGLVAAPLLATPAAKLEPRAATTTTAKHPYITQVLDRHNAHRKNNTASALTWNHDIAVDARTLAQRCVFNHDTTIGAGGYGQNLAAGWSREDVGYAITNGWYNEYTQYVGEYSETTPSNFENVGHFTQVVWLGTTSVGCATFDCSVNGGLRSTTGQVLGGLDNFTVCNYSPPGNWLGEFNVNVKQSIGLPPYSGPLLVT